MVFIIKKKTKKASILLCYITQSPSIITYKEGFDKESYLKDIVVFLRRSSFKNKYTTSFKNDYPVKLSIYIRVKIILTVSWVNLSF